MERILMKYIGVPFLAVVFVACGGANHAEHPQLFYGDCEMSIRVSPDHHPEVLLDGVHLHGYSAITVPCGEKRVTVSQKGFVPYEAYHNVKDHEPLVVKVSLKKAVPLNAEVLQPAFLEKVAKMEKWAIAAVKKPDAATPESPSTAEDTGDPMSVDYWR